MAKYLPHRNCKAPHVTEYPGLRGAAKRAVEAADKRARAGWAAFKKSLQETAELATKLDEAPFGERGAALAAFARAALQTEQLANLLTRLAPRWKPVFSATLLASENGSCWPLHLAQQQQEYLYKMALRAGAPLMELSSTQRSLEVIAVWADDASAAGW